MIFYFKNFGVVEPIYNTKSLVQPEQEQLKYIYDIYCVYLQSGLHKSLTFYFSVATTQGYFQRL